jgi:hypothetical protein
MATPGRTETSPLLDALIKDLAGWDYAVTSEVTYEYNCIAWAADDDSRWWWPNGEPYCFWPEGVPAEETIAAFVKAYETIGYHVCDDDSYGPDADKIAIYLGEGGTPRHAARQVDELYWTSKLGGLHDVKHPLRALEAEYGSAMVFMSRPRRIAGKAGSKARKVKRRAR